MIKMLKGLVPEVALPAWFDVTSKSTDRGTTLTLHGVIDGKVGTIEHFVEKDSVTIAELVSMFPHVKDEVPTMVMRVLAMIPVPRYCKITGGPSSVQEIPGKEVARLSVEAKVLARTINWHWDSTLDRLYMADLVEMVEVLKRAQGKTKEGPT